MSPALTLDGLLRSATARLTHAGVASPAVDAELLLAHVLGQALGELRKARVLGTPVDEARIPAFRDLLERRAAREPLQHLTGVAHFGGLELSVGPGVFVPRPETEVLLGLALAAVEHLPQPVVVDLCTGSGALALAIAAARPGARVGAVELSEDAFGYAVTNRDRTGLAVDLRLGCAQDAFEDWAGEVDLVVSNPPYIPPDAVPVDPEVRDHDPEIALYGRGHDGLDVPRRVAAVAEGLLRPGGLFVMEHAEVQSQALVRHLTQAGRWGDVQAGTDHAGRPRFVSATLLDS